MTTTDLPHVSDAQLDAWAHCAECHLRDIGDPVIGYSLARGMGLSELLALIREVQAAREQAIVPLADTRQRCRKCGNTYTRVCYCEEVN